MKASIQARQFVLTEAPSPSAPLPDGEAPPPYNTLPPTGGLSQSLPTPQVPLEGAGCYPVGWQGFPIEGPESSPYHRLPTDVKLGYMDFVPRLTKKKVFQDNEYENFSTLIQRANDWLEEHTWIKLMSCETITWCGLKANKIYSDSSCFDRSINAAVKTRNLIGLRLWFTQDAFPNHSKTPTTTVIECRTFIPRHDKETLDQMIDRINQVLIEDSMSGSIFTAEIVPVVCKTSSDYRPGCMNPSLCFWREDPEFNKLYAMCVRIYAKLVPDMKFKETLGYKSFVPQYNGQSKENKGFEVFENVFEKASRWISSQTAVRFISVKSINVKVKKKGVFDERCVYKEHLWATKRENIFTGLSSVTKYLRIVRAFYVITREVTSEVNPMQSHLQPRLTTRTFVPAQIGAIATSLPVNMCNMSPYEETRRVLERINHWLSITGAHIFHVETIPFRESLPQKLGPEATFSQTSLGNSRSDVEHLVHNIRLYLDGEYREPPGAISLVIPSVRPR